MSRDLEFRDCPCCSAFKYALMQDKVHLDWARECLACGYQLELMPRAATRVTAYAVATVDDTEWGDAVRAGLKVGELEGLFEVLNGE